MWKLTTNYPILSIRFNVERDGGSYNWLGCEKMLMEKAGWRQRLKEYCDGVCLEEFMT